MSFLLIAKNKRIDSIKSLQKNLFLAVLKKSDRPKPDYRKKLIGDRLV